MQTYWGAWYIGVSTLAVRSQETSHTQGSSYLPSHTTVTSKFLEVSAEMVAYFFFNKRMVSYMQSSYHLFFFYSHLALLAVSHKPQTCSDARTRQLLTVVLPKKSLRALSLLKLQCYITF